MDKSTLYMIVIGALAGYVAGNLFKGENYGLLGNIVIGVIGSVLGGFIFSFFNVKLQAGFIGSLVTATVGAIVALWLIQKISGSGRSRSRR